MIRQGSYNKIDGLDASQKEVKAATRSRILFPVYHSTYPSSLNVVTGWEKKNKKKNLISEGIDRVNIIQEDC